MKAFASLFFMIFFVLSIPETKADLCWGSGWGGCNDGGCRASGGYCVNYGVPPNNNCQCIFD